MFLLPATASSPIKRAVALNTSWRVCTVRFSRMQTACVLQRDVISAQRIIWSEGRERGSV